MSAPHGAFTGIPEEACSDAFSRLAAQESTLPASMESNVKYGPYFRGLYNSTAAVRVIARMILGDDG